jgi:hypothetical protein
MVGPGQAVDVTKAGAKTVSKSTISARDKARTLAVGKVGGAPARCALSIPLAANVVSVAPAGKSWKVTVKTTKGATTWTVAGSKLTATNALAKRIVAGCP